MKKQKPKPSLGDVRHEAIQLLGMAHFISRYNPDDLPLIADDKFWGFGSTMEEKVQRILELLDAIEMGR